MRIVLLVGSFLFLANGHLLGNGGAVCKLPLFHALL